MRPLDLLILSKAIGTIPEAMGLSLIRTAYSSLAREARDIATGIFDSQGRTVAQSEFIPILVAALEPALEGVLRKHPRESWRPGDCAITNDPFAGGQHLNDIAVFTPMFDDARLIGFAGSMAHHLDLGGITPGIMNGATEVHHEGLILPALKVRLEDGAFDRPLLELLLANSRAPEELAGDLSAQLSANHTAGKRIAELVARHGADAICSTMTHMQDVAEGLMRTALLALPRETFTAKASVDDDGEGSGPLTIMASLTCDGERLHVDFAGSASQVRGMVNSTRASTLAAVQTALVQYLSSTSSRLVANHGAFRNVSVHIPAGSILDPHPPASVHARFIAAYRAYEAVAMALVQALPARAQATGFNGTAVFAISRQEGARHSILADIACGGWGADAQSDGADGLPSPLSNCSNVPAEWLEYRFPHLRLARYEFRDGSGGDGLHRGGRGEVRQFEILEDGLRFVAMCDRFVEGAAGHEGGQAGSPGKFIVIRRNEVIALPSKCSFMLEAGDVLQICTGGGGGYGLR